jgi:hypothetical protein
MSDDKEYPCKYECGKVLASRAGIYKHEQKCSLNNMGETEETVVEDSLSPDSIEVGETPTSPTIDDEQPEYTQYTFSVDELETNIPVPTPLKMLIGADKDKKSGKKKSKQELLNMSKTNVAMLKMVYKSTDNLASRYRVAICNDEEMIISHSEADYNWISGMSNQYLMDKGFDINSYIGSGKAAIICNAWWFGSIGATLHSDAKKLDKSLGLIRKPISWVKKILSFIPIIGKRFKNKPEIAELGQTTMEEWQQ